jgi:hypothetical protein
MVRDYGRMGSVMRVEDCRYLDEILRLGRLHSPEVSMANIDPETGFILSVLVEIMKKIHGKKDE